MSQLPNSINLVHIFMVFHAIAIVELFIRNQSCSSFILQILLNIIGQPSEPVLLFLYNLLDLNLPLLLLLLSIAAPNFFDLLDILILQLIEPFLLQYFFHIVVVNNHLFSNTQLKSINIFLIYQIISLLYKLFIQKLVYQRRLPYNRIQFLLLQPLTCRKPFHQLLDLTIHIIFPQNILQYRHDPQISPVRQFVLIVKYLLTLFYIPPIQNLFLLIPLTLQHRLEFLFLFSIIVLALILVLIIAIIISLFFQLNCFLKLQLILLFLFRIVKQKTLFIL